MSLQAKLSLYIFRFKFYNLKEFASVVMLQDQNEVILCHNEAKYWKTSVNIYFLRVWIVTLEKSSFLTSWINLA